MQTLHRIFLLVFMLGVALSAIFSILEYRWISHTFTELRKLRNAYIAKGVIAGVLILCAIAFAASLYEGSSRKNETATFIAGNVTDGWLNYILNSRTSRHS